MYIITGAKLEAKMKMYEQVRTSYKMGLTSLRELGKKYVVSHNTIREIVRGKESDLKWVKELGDENVTPF